MCPSPATGFRPWGLKHIALPSHILDTMDEDITGRCSRPQNSLPSTTKDGTPNTPCSSMATVATSSNSWKPAPAQNSSKPSTPMRGRKEEHDHDRRNVCQEGGVNIFCVMAWTWCVRKERGNLRFPKRRAVHFWRKPCHKCRTPFAKRGRKPDQKNRTAPRCHFWNNVWPTTSLGRKVNCGRPSQTCDVEEAANKECGTYPKFFPCHIWPSIPKYSQHNGIQKINSVQNRTLTMLDEKNSWMKK
jgi:hypothetical protein